MYAPLADYSSCQTSEDAHEYIMGLKQCLLDELTQSEDGSGVTISGSDYDENLYMSMKTFLGLIQRRTVHTYGYMHIMWQYF